MPHMEWNIDTLMWKSFDINAFERLIYQFWFLLFVENHKTNSFQFAFPLPIPFFSLFSSDTFLFLGLAFIFHSSSPIWCGLSTYTTFIFQFNVHNILYIGSTFILLLLWKHLFRLIPFLWCVRVGRKDVHRVNFSLFVF